jgi:hypothetical protein
MIPSEGLAIALSIWCGQPTFKQCAQDTLFNLVNKLHIELIVDSHAAAW